ncbi:S-adenosyl-L-methionine-dependent methyltransferase [Chytriomyces sp. MP71]|nr:S-adenosyl-L-methionine-dependent methyltransferase [Chytriomyces sp. MP71]
MIENRNQFAPKTMGNRLTVPMTRSKSKRPAAATATSPIAKAAELTSGPAPTAFVKADSGSSINNEAVFWHPRDNDTDREYHNVATSDYMLPADMKEQNRLEFQHNMLKMLFGDDIICPDAKRVVKRKGAKVLDVGCAAGAWLDAVFVYNSDAEYHGCDIATELLDWPVAKCVFGNVLERLPYEDNSFDYVHQRFLTFGIPKNKWPAVVAELIRVTKPGGWIELMEFDAVHHRMGPNHKKLADAVYAMMRTKEIDLENAGNIAGYVDQGARLASIDLAHFKKRTVSCPINWDGKIGAYAGKDLEFLFESLRPVMPKVLGVEPEEYDAMVKELIEEAKTYKSFVNMTCVYAQVVKK